FLGYRVTVCDARPVFATPKRFPDAHEVIVEWPHRYLQSEVEGGRIDERTVLCVLTHDPKFDVPLLEVALRLPVAYIGAMGSRRTHEERLDRLREAGMTDAELARLSSPIGLDLGARTPEETAVSIAAEIYAGRPAHRDAAVTVLAVEALDTVAAELGMAPFDPRAPRRTVVLRSAEVEALRGLPFALDCGEGEVLLQGGRPAHPCAWMDLAL